MNSPAFVTRRQALQQLACGFGYLALAGLASQVAARAAPNPLASRAPHFPPRAKRVIFLFMGGGVSHLDSFDYKPRLYADDGKMMDFLDQRSIAKTGAGSTQRVMKPLWEFKQRGQSGRWVSELFPHLANHVDDYCVVRSMHTEGVAHGPATLFLHTGSTNLIRPSMGSWVSYGLGSENENLPAFVSLSPTLANGGPRNYGNAFLPSVYQGTAIGRGGQLAKDAGIRNIHNPKWTPAQQQRNFELVRALNEVQLRMKPGDLELEAVANSFELAWRLQNHAPDVLDLAKETPATLALYGIGEEPTDNFGRQCLMARRMAESGVRFIQVNYSDNSNNPGWDQHSNMPKHKEHAERVDKPVAGLLADLKSRGLLDDTIVWFGSEFGRTPYAERNGTGRDHNPTGFSVLLAGGGFKPGIAYGETDEFGHFAIANKVHMHDLHATILHQLGLDHERLTFRHDGRDFRLTDVHGHVVKDLLI
ncbi:DUF1501 domain-containing protein [Horticoccus sp. 23ND18S-11]|uniref:DUF1501 domain-containing protein n=1 Tax=Horticoccus sp. 23ND18S-11 TaxID=3391832 RepID=UPI0039C9528C